MNPQILLQAAGLLVAKLPQIEQGVHELLTIAGGQVMLHRILSSGEVLSAEMNLPRIRAILQAADSLQQAAG